MNPISPVSFSPGLTVSSVRRSTLQTSMHQVTRHDARDGIPIPIPIPTNRSNNPLHNRDDHFRRTNALGRGDF